MTFGGRLVLDGFAPVRWEDVTASGTNVHLRYPEGFNSIVDAELRLSGPYTAPTLSGTVNVKSALYARPIDPGLLGLAAAAGAPAATAASPAAAFISGANLVVDGAYTRRVN